MNGKINKIIEYLIFSFQRSLEVEPAQFSTLHTKSASTPNKKRRALSAQRTENGKRTDSSPSLINNKMFVFFKYYYIHFFFSYNIFFRSKKYDCEKNYDI